MALLATVASAWEATVWGSKLLSVGLAGCAIVLGACGSGDDGAQRPTTPSADGSPTSTTAAGPTIEVELRDGAIVGLPAEVAVGTTIRAVNTSDTEMHELLAIRLPDGEDRTSEEIVALPEDELIALLGAAVPDVLRVALPGEPELEGVGDAVFEEPGRYLVICTVPTGADPAVLIESDRYTTGRWPERYADAAPHHARGEHTDVLVR